MAKTICNDISNYITGVIPLESNSASRTDTYILNFKDGVTFNNIPVNKGFMKIYLNMNDNSNLDYEARIYSEITNKILLLNINPGFVLNYAYVKGCTLDNILSMFKGLKDKNNKELTNENGIIPTLLFSIKIIFYIRLKDILLYCFYIVFLK